MSPPAPDQIDCVDSMRLAPRRGERDLARRRVGVAVAVDVAIAGGGPILI